MTEATPAACVVGELGRPKFRENIWHWDPGDPQGTTQGPPPQLLVLKLLVIKLLVLKLLVFKLLFANFCSQNFPGGGCVRATRR